MLFRKANLSAFTFTSKHKAVSQHELKQFNTTLDPYTLRNWRWVSNTTVKATFGFFFQKQLLFLLLCIFDEITGI